MLLVMRRNLDDIYIHSTQSFACNSGAIVLETHTCSIWRRPARIYVVEVECTRTVWMCGRLTGCFVRLGVSGAGCLSAPALVVSPPLVFSLCCSLSCVASLMADVPKLSITLLGAGQEVGRSCCVLQYRGRTIVCDAGVHPAYSGIASLPFIDELDWSTVDVLLITQYVLPVFFPLPVLTIR